MTAVFCVFGTIPEIIAVEVPNEKTDKTAIDTAPA